MVQDVSTPEVCLQLESRWTHPDLNWRDHEVISAGVDVGSVSTQSVVMVDGMLYCCGSKRTGYTLEQSALEVTAWILEGTGLTLDKIQLTVGTGYGRVHVPFASKNITEIACIARGANFMYGANLRTILDVGGQDCKAIHCDQQGKVEAFLMNDKCAAGTGRGLEVFADLLGLPIDALGEMSLQVEAEPPPISSTCVVFAKDEALGLLRQGWPKEKVLAAYCLATAQRIASLLERIGLNKEYAVTGGIAKNPGVMNRLSNILGIVPLSSRIDSQIAGALGAALFAKALYEKKKKKPR